MRIALTYTSIPAYGELSSLHLQYDQLKSARARLWVHLPGQEPSRPWWLDYGEEASEPEYLNEQTTRIISNLIQGLKLDAAPAFASGAEGTIRELEFLAGDNRVKYVWLETLPPQWQDFASLLAFFDGFMEARQPGFQGG